MAEQDKIIFSTDFSDTSLAALPWARQLSEKLGAELHCVTAVQELSIYMPLTEGGTVPLPSIDELRREAESHLDDFARKHLGGMAKSPVSKVLQGRAADEICRYADEIDAAMIVLATHGRSGVAHMVLGSTAEAVLRQANCPVLTIRAQ
jgi:nucleotide-binding universal stress UspA family protein